MWNHIPSLQALRLFDAVVRHRSMTKAAAEEGVSQSAVSQSIKHLEGFVGAPLLNRSTRPMILTSAGETFHRVCIETLGRLAHSVEEMRCANNRTENAVTVSCNLGFATYWLMPRLNYFSAEHPNIEVHVMVAYQGAAGLHDGSDVAIRYGNGKWPDGPWETLFKESLLPVCAPSYLDAHEPIGSLRELANRRLIHVAVTDPDWSGWDQYFKRAGHDGVLPSGGLRFGNYVQAVQAALAGEGVMLGWRSVVGDLLESGQLTTALDMPVPLQNGYFVNRPAGLSADSTQSTFINWLARQAGKAVRFNEQATQK